MLGLRRPGDLDSLRICVSAGETLPKPTWHAWHDATGIKLMDGIGATEMLHIFIAAPILLFLGERRLRRDAGTAKPAGQAAKSLG